VYLCVVQVMEVAAALGHVTVMLKGREDIISDGHQWVVSTETGAMRRSGGLGKKTRLTEASVGEPSPPWS
jgi:hypothetical protein